MTKEEWYNSLPKKVRKAFKKNANAQSDDFFNYWIKFGITTGIMGAFSFDLSPEGYDYWCWIEKVSCPEKWGTVDMNAQEQIDSLDTDIKTKFLHNLHSQKRVEDYPQYWINTTTNIKRHGIGGAFDWSVTPEWRDFWKDIDDKLTGRL